MQNFRGSKIVTTEVICLAGPVVWATSALAWIVQKPVSRDGFLVFSTFWNTSEKPKAKTSSQCLAKHKANKKTQKKNISLTKIKKDYTMAREGLENNVIYVILIVSWLRCPSSTNINQLVSFLSTSMLWIISQPYVAHFCSSFRTWTGEVYLPFNFCDMRKYMEFTSQNCKQKDQKPGGTKTPFKDKLFSKNQFWDLRLKMSMLTSLTSLVNQIFDLEAL